MDPGTILIAHREPSRQASWSAELTLSGHDVRTAGTAEEALEAMQAAPCDLVVVDALLGAGGAAAAIEEIKRVRPATLVVVTGEGRGDTVLAAFRAGAIDFLEEPVEPGRIAEITSIALSKLELGAERRRLAEDLKSERMRVLELERRLLPEDAFKEIVGGSLLLKSLLETLREVARTDSTVLLTGESGTGKGLLARAIHQASNRCLGPFVEANCVVYSEGVLHSELFGHERGAFTGAARLKRGRFELASGGTLFLDEIGEISPATQLLLLRVLQDRTFERVGGEETVDANVRLIAATNRDLTEAMRRGSFRSDLFYRLNVIPVHVPPLREHAEDVALLAQHFVERSASRAGRPVAGFSPEALEILARYPWPGNIRELENLVERVVVLSRGEWIGVDDLPSSLRDAALAPSGEPPGTLQDMEKRRIQEVLRATGGNKKLAASRLGIHRSTLYAKMRRYAIPDPSGSRRGEDVPDTAERPEPVRG